VTSLVELILVAEHRRGHGAMYDALNQGRVEPERVRRTLVSLPLPRAADGRIVLAVDASRWLRPDAPTSAERLFCRRSFRNIRARAVLPARAPKPTHPGPGRPPGSRNSRPAASHDVGKTGKRDRTITERQQHTG
jgi:hypothetical protein